MSKEDLKTKMKADLTSVTAKLERAREKAAIANARVEKLAREQYALQSALDVLDSTGPVRPQYKPAFDLGNPSETARTWAPIPSFADGQQFVEFNGEKIVLEPGFRVGKNSFGEDVLLPAGMPDLSPMAEPILTGHAPSVLPPIGGDEGFTSDLPGGI